MMAWVKYGWLQLGTMGRLGVYLLLGAVIVWVARVLPSEHEANKLSQQLEQARRGANPKLAVKPRRLEDFYALFPSLDTLPDQLSAVDQAAGAANLTIKEAQYQLQPVQGLALQRYQVSLPVAGDYPSLRGFLNKVMGSASNAVLDEVRFEREESKDIVVARLRLSFYYRGSTPATGAAP